MIDLGSTEHDAISLGFGEGAEAARLIWDDSHEVETIIDPRTPDFAHGMIDTSVEILRSSKGLVKKMIDRAAAGAEDLAVAQFQGIIEVIQNADDVRASEVRFALRARPDASQLLIVHDGEPVTCHNVLGMALPYLTTKSERPDQRGRFGIGIKTLKRIADSVAIHSAPYHFSGDQLRFKRIDAEAAIPGFYEPSRDTLLVVDLNETFEKAALEEWFETWRDDSLLFLASVGRFRWCAMDGTTFKERALSFSPWVDASYAPLHPSFRILKSRRVDGPSDSWTVWKATIEVPTHLHPAHKARSETTDISIALADKLTRPGLFIGFRTHVALSLPFSVDAQFDPSTSREAIIENPWNNWLIDRVCEVTADVAAGMLSSRPKAAWPLVPLAQEHVGEEDNPWIRARFAAGLAATRTWLGQTALMALPATTSALADVAYEDETLAGLLSESDVERIAAGRHALHEDVRDETGRWRQVLDELGVSTIVGTGELLEALSSGEFTDKPAQWWVEAGARLVTHHPDDELFGQKFLLSDRDRAVTCEAEHDTEKPLVFDAEPSAFATRWKLLERLHPAYGKGGPGKQVIEWLTANAAFTSHLDAAIEIAAFAEHFKGEKIEIADDELRDLRDRFDDVSDRRAEELGPSVGAVLLLDGHVFKSGKMIRQKVALSESYLCKTLDGENSTWPDAAGPTPGIAWIAARYESVLKTAAGRWAKRKRDDGSVSRGPRRFLTLLGAETAPRVLKTGELVRWGDSTRVAELRQHGGEQVQYDLLAPDLNRVLKSLQKLPKRDTKRRSPALLRCLSRNWDRVYAKQDQVPAQHVAIKYTYGRGDVTAAWLNELRDTQWVAVGRGELVEPRFAVLRTPETQAVYQAFAFDLSRDDVHDDLASALHLITDVRVGDLLDRLEELRDGTDVADDSQTLPIYRTIAKRCPKNVMYNTRIGELSVQELRRKFLEGPGLVHIRGDLWRRPDEVLRGVDIFHDRRVFVPGGASCAPLWRALDVAEPGLDDCIQFCRDLAQEPYSADVESSLMDVYRYIERLAVSAERKHRDKLRRLALYCGGEWLAERPIYYLENAELRTQLVRSVAALKCWVPPCDVRDFPHLVNLLSVETLDPLLEVREAGDEAAESGEQIRLRFGHAVDHLSAELARSAPGVRDHIAIGWDELKSIPLYIYDHDISVQAISPGLPADGVQISMKALAQQSPHSFHLRDDDIGDRDFGGRLVASLFPSDTRRRIDGEWALAWQKSRDSAAEEIRLASDLPRTEAMKEAAEAINAGPKGKIKITPPKSRNAASKPRTLKGAVGAVVGATVHAGSTREKPASKPSRGGGLLSKPPAPGGSNNTTNPTAPAAYTNADLEQRGWEILAQALETSPDQRLVDFRNRHGVGADGVIDWKRFVEMKATARGPQTQVELSNNEFERAKQRGSDFVLALVSGLETGYKDEVRLIFDPANCASLRPTNGVKLVSLLEAPAVIVHFEELGDNN